MRERWSRVHVPKPHFCAQSTFAQIGSGHYSFVPAKLSHRQTDYRCAERAVAALRKLVNHYLQKLVCLGYSTTFPLVSARFLSRLRLRSRAPPTYATMNTITRSMDAIDSEIVWKRNALGDVFSNHLAHKKHATIWYGPVGPNFGVTDAAAGRAGGQVCLTETAPRVTNTVANAQASALAVRL